MIKIELKGRLGNQLFKYAFARSLKEKRGGHDNLVVGVSQFKGLDADAGWRNSLSDFNVSDIRETGGRVVMEDISITQKIVFAIYYAYVKIVMKLTHKERFEVEQPLLDFASYFGLYLSYDNHHNFSVSRNKVCIVDGSFENQVYFNNIRDILLSELTPKSPPIEANLNLYKIIENSESVCVTIRRGDYVSNIDNSRLFYQCSSDYYERAIKYMMENISNPVFVFFSDDIEWVRNNIRCDVECHYESGNDPVWEKLRLMYSCKHFIISNSTFSWWAQYLSRNKGKVVVSPPKWFNGDGPAYLLNDNFINI